MTELLEVALAKVARLSPEQQDAIAALILEELEDEQRWDEAFAASHDALARLADQIRADIRADRTVQGGFDGRHIEVTPGVRSGKPRLAGTRITVADIAIMHFRLGQSVAEIARTYELSLASVHAALAYYYDHQAQIDRSIEEDLAFAEAFRRDNPSPLREKLKALGGG